MFFSSEQQQKVAGVLEQTTLKLALLRKKRLDALKTYQNKKTKREHKEILEKIIHH